MGFCLVMLNGSNSHSMMKEDLICKRKKKNYPWNLEHNEGKKITSYSLGPEASGEAEYPSNNITSYLKYNCNYCLDPFYLVDPDTHEAGGVIQREVVKKSIMGKTLDVKTGKEVRGVCLQCCKDQLSYQQSKYFW